MKPEGHCRSRISIHWAAAIAVSAGVFAASAVTVKPTRIHADANQYLIGAYHLYEHGTLSLESDPDDPPKPSAFRLPAYPLALSGVIAINPHLQDRSLERYSRAGKNRDPLFLPLLVFQKGLLTGVALLSYVAAYILTRRFAVAWLAFSGVVFTPALTPFKDYALWSEPLAAILVVGVCTALVTAFRKDLLRWHLLAGGLLGMLILTKASYLFFAPLAVLLVGLRPKASVKHRLRCAAAFAFALAVPVVPWIGRNVYHFDYANISLRGGQALAERAFLNRMAYGELNAAFVFYTPCVPDEVKRRELDKDARQHLMGWRCSESYFKKAKQRQKQLRSRFGADLGPKEVHVDRNQRQWAIRHILEAPVRHVVVSLALAYRALFVERTCWSPLLWFSLLGVLLLWRKRWPGAIGVFFLPIIFHLAFYTFVTRNVYRFYFPVIPVLWISAAVAVVYGSEYLWKRRRAIGWRAR